MSSRRRRYALHYLTQRAESVTIRDLSEQIAAWENNVERSAVTPKERKRVYTALHQTHLPKMDRLGVVVYDNDRGTVTLTDSVREFDIYLDVVPSDDLPWSQFYLALGGVLTALVAVAALGIPLRLLRRVRLRAVRRADVHRRRRLPRPARPAHAGRDGRDAAGRGRDRAERDDRGHERRLSYGPVPLKLSATDILLEPC
ncbi:DUF7344 domain-containing protein [Halosegnis marinus]|uniref:DUF7344 domain-containing protein n=1 Tax=Halosegnis marinus TaxID=3034023 RepID=UPI003607D94C